MFVRWYACQGQMYLMLSTCHVSRWLSTRSSTLSSFSSVLSSTRWVMLTICLVFYSQQQQSCVYVMCNAHIAEQITWKFDFAIAEGRQAHRKSSFKWSRHCCAAHEASFRFILHCNGLTAKWSLVNHSAVVCALKHSEWVQLLWKQLIHAILQLKVLIMMHIHSHFLLLFSCFCSPVLCFCWPFRNTVGTYRKA